MKKQKILYTIPNFNTAGSGKALLNLALGLDKEKFQPEILCLHSKGVFFETVKKSGIPIHIFNYLPKERPFLKMIVECYKVSRKLKEINPEIIHSFNYSSNYTEAISAKMAGIQWIFTKKNMNWGGNSRRGWKLRSFLANKIIVQNKDMIKQFYPKSSKISLISRGVVVNNFTNEKPNQEVFHFMKTNLNDRIIITVANLTPVKGIEILIKAFSDVSINTDWILWIIGDYNNDYGFKIMQMVKDKNLGNKIKFSGKQNQVKPFLDCAEIFVLPTLDKGEGSPVALLEAMANSKVVIASNVSGINDQLEYYKDHLFESSNSIELSNKLNYFMAMNKKDLSKIGKQFESFVKTDFSIEIEINKHENTYKSLDV